MNVCPNPILMVDDDPDIRDALRGILEDEGYSVEEAANGREALTLLEKVTPCVILLDLMMPVMDGFQFLEAVSGTPRASLPVIVLTAQPSGALQDVRKVLHKPVPLDVLLASIAEHCSSATS
jgi:two-component system chemotaxis response regulator CheY